MASDARELDGLGAGCGRVASEATELLGLGAGCGSVASLAKLSLVSVEGFAYCFILVFMLYEEDSACEIAKLAATISAIVTKTARALFTFVLAGIVSPWL